MNKHLERWNRLPALEAENEILACCGSRSWARAMAERRPISEEAMLLAAADEIWRNLRETDWMEAFASHPRIGESRTVGPNSKIPASARSARWSAEEQSQAGNEEETVKAALAIANRNYEKRFGRTFIVCATGKSAFEILQILRHRLENAPRTELHQAAAEQSQITRIRLQRWLAE